MTNRQQVFTQITVEDVVEWILKHRGVKVFKGWHRDQITVAVEIGIQQNLFLFATDESPSKELVGVCLLRKKEPFKIHVNQILFLGRQEGLMKQFLLRFQELWPATKYLTFDRRGQRKEYSLKALSRLL